MLPAWLVHSRGSLGSQSVSSCARKKQGACSGPVQRPLQARERRAARPQAGHCKAIARATRDGGFVATFCADAANATANLLALLEAGRDGALPRALVLAGEARTAPRLAARAVLPARRTQRMRAPLD